MVLTDVNVLVYAHRRDSAQYDACRKTLEGMIGADQAYGVSELVLSSFVRDRPRLQRDSGNMTSMALSRKKATTIALDPEDDRLLTRAARERGVSRAELVRQQLALMLEQYRSHPRPASAGMVRSLAERGNERELFRGRR